MRVPQQRAGGRQAATTAGKPTGPARRRPYQTSSLLSSLRGDARPTDYTRQPAPPGLVFTVVALVGLLLLASAMWVGGQVASVVSGHGFASGTVLSGFGSLFAFARPGRMWSSPMPAAWLYWPIVLVTTAAVLGGLSVLALRVQRWRRGRAGAGVVAAMSRRPGMAADRHVDQAMGDRALLSRGAAYRPGLAGGGEPIRAVDVGWDWGALVGGSRHVWTSVRDAVVLLGPSGAGKTAYVVIPRILDAPGALIATSIRPDVLTATFEARSQIGPVSVIAADGSVSGLPSVMAWSPIRGCEDAESAQVRAKVLAAGTSNGVENGSFWEGQTEAVLKFLLHAAALKGADIHEFWRWTLNPGAATPAEQVLDTHPGAEPQWGAALRGILAGDERTLGNIWGGVRTAMAGLDASAVRNRFNPAPGQHFDVVRFLRAKGTLYLLSKENDPASRMLSALIADVTRIAKLVADASPGQRMDPPLTLMLDEVGNFAKLPDLPTWVSGFGGSGIVTQVVIQGIDQMRATWGDEAAGAIWQAATIKVVLGGVTDADDLRDFSALTGMRDEMVWSSSRQGPGQNSVSSTVRQVSVLTEGDIRSLPEGTALMLVKGNPPAMVAMVPYFRRPEAARLAADRAHWEQVIEDQAAARLAALGGAEQPLQDSDAGTGHTGPRSVVDAWPAGPAGEEDWR